MYDKNNDKENGKRIIGLLDNMDWLEYNIKNNAYIHCEAPLPLVNLVKIIEKNGGKVFGLTECNSSFEYNAKYNRLKECYTGSFLHHGDLISVSSRHDKVSVMKYIAERDHLDMDEIMFIDDSFFEIMEAADKGILAMHTTEALIRFYNTENFNTEGISG